MKPPNRSPRSASMARGGRTPLRIGEIPMEWMDPMSWRLPSGKALAEFALQAGFLAPLMLGTPGPRRRWTSEARMAPPVVDHSHAQEGPERTGSFRGAR